jgi:hypothetical protein
MNDITQNLLILKRLTKNFESALAKNNAHLSYEIAVDMQEMADQLVNDTVIWFKDVSQ